MREQKDYHLQDPTWCLGCGIYSLFSGMKKTAGSLDLDPEKMMLVTGIGCHGRLNNYFKAYGFHALHGRSLPLATGIKLANPELTVIAVVGDGDAYSIGLGHFIQSVRRNVGITCIVVDNMVFALTQGQTSPTSRKGFVSPSTPFGSVELPLSGPMLALESGGTFIARGFSGAPKQLTSLIEQGIKHKGFSFIEVLSPCVTHNKINTYDWYKNNTYQIDEETGHDTQNKDQARRFLQREKMALGLLYQEKRPSFDELVLPDKEPLVHSPMALNKKKWEEILEKFE
jgi:2-oxoglutarate ferredoxin oxidoreductase subunit beta